METNKALMRIENLSKSFVGVKAVNGLTFEVGYKEIFGLIGPNGAGKTTVFNLISKLYEPDEGRIYLEGRDITRAKAHRVNRMGIARTFQNIRLLKQLTVLENVLVGLSIKNPYSMGNVIFNNKRYLEIESENKEKAEKFLYKAGLSERITDRADSLPYGLQRQLEIARALATDPKILLMDEPAAGMNLTEKNRLKQYVKRIVEEGVSVILIEHDMSFAMDLCERITVLNYGKKIAEGHPQAIQSNEEVIEAYLGSRDYAKG